MQIQELWVNRNNFNDCKIVNSEIKAITQGEVLLEIDKFAMTSNNVTYAVVGDLIGYWNRFLAENGWGIIPVWGCANVVESNHPNVKVGERFWGFLPAASHVVMLPSHATNEYFIDGVEHAQGLPTVYRSYRRTALDPAELQKMENERCLLFPLFATSFTLADYLKYYHYFAAEQVIIGSASSKTAIGLAQLLSSDQNKKVQVIGMTSNRNKAFVESLGIYNQVLTYHNETQINAKIPSAFIDFSGDNNLTSRIHHHLQNNIKESCMVGATHWDQGGDKESLPGAKPTMFFAPGHFKTRDAELGEGQMLMRGMMAGIEISKALDGLMNIEWLSSSEALKQLWLDLLANKIDPKTGIMVNLNSE